MIISEYIEVKITKHNIKWYKSKKYNVELKDIISVYWQDLPSGTKKEIILKCDYCQAIFNRQFSSWQSINKSSPIKKDACSNCRCKKTEESNMLVYGVTSVMHVDEYKKAQEQSIIDKYGCSSPLKNPEILAKVQKTNIQRYGGTTPAHSKEVTEKAKKTSLKKYGATSYLATEEGKKRVAETNLEKYGHEYASSSLIVREKVRKTNLERYGYDSFSKTQEFKDKITSTNLEKYGSEWYMQTEDFKKKAKETNINRYGFEHPSSNAEIASKIYQTTIRRHGEDFYSSTMKSVWENHRKTGKDKEISDKRKATNLEKYGVENVLDNEKVKEKIKNTLIQKYDVDNVMKNPDFVQKVRKTNMQKYGVSNPMHVAEFKQKVMNSLYQNGTAPSSKQQKHIHELVGGELNLPFENFFLDIAFQKDRIYLEYDGGGHDLPVKLGKMAIDTFIEKEKRRTYFLIRRGWKEIRIISSDDKLHTDEKIKSFVEKAKDFLLCEKSSSIRWDMDNDTVSISYKEFIQFNEFINKDVGA